MESRKRIQQTLRDAKVTCSPQISAALMGRRECIINQISPQQASRKATSSPEKTRMRQQKGPRRALVKMHRFDALRGIRDQ